MRKCLRAALYVPPFVFLFLTAALAGPTPPVKRLDDVNRQTWINNLTDSVATLGMDDREKKRVKLQRKNIRKQMRIQKENDRRNAATKKKIKKQNQTIMKKVNDKKKAARKKK